jgi:hypothetical protein
MRAFLGEGQLGTIAVKLGAPLDKLLNRRRTFLDQPPHRLRIAQSVSGGDGVLLMKRDLVLVAQSHRHATLGVLRGGLFERIFSYDQYIAGRGEIDSRAKSGDAGSNDQKIGIQTLVFV